VIGRPEPALAFHPGEVPAHGPGDAGLAFQGPRAHGERPGFADTSAASGINGGMGAPPGQDGEILNPCAMPAPLGERLRTVVSMALFVVLAGYVGFSAIRLGLLLWQRVAAA